MEKYDHKKIEKKWQKYWQDKKIYKTSDATDKPKYYILDMFPYPSGAGLHVGHPKGFIATDIFARTRMLKGYNVLHPMGWDAFGLPAENYAIQNKIHPRAATEKNVATFKKQLGLLGFTYDWSREINTTDPAYYKWTQWTFLKMFERGLAYEAYEPINWCPGCQTGLSNEDLEDGKCERCGSAVEKKPMRQWMLKITAYAERLLDDLKKLPDWEEAIKEMQKNWIGKSEGATVKFLITFSGEKEKKKILIGTRNPAKVKMIKSCFKHLNGVELVSLDDLPPLDDSELVEDDDAVANAKRKAEFYFKKTGLPTIATDHILWIEKWPENNGFITHIRKLANPKSPRAADEEVILFLKSFLKKHGGQSLAHFNYAIAYTDETGTTATQVIPREYVLQLDQAPEYWPGYPTEALLKDPVSGIYKTQENDEVRYGKVKEVIEKNFAGRILEQKNIEVFTTRIDTIFSGTFLILAPEHRFLEENREKIANWPEVEAYIKKSKNISEIDRTAEGKDWSGVEVKGVRAVNPATGDPLTVWVADFVLANYGTGAVFADAHDGRDFYLGKKYRIPLKVSIAPDQASIPAIEKLETCFEGEGILFNSAQFDGLTSAAARPKIIDWLKTRGLAEPKVNYKLRDWVFSRQRYWGEPIPIVHCEACKNKKYNFIFIHGYNSSFNVPWKLWLKAELEKKGHTVYGPELPNPAKPSVEEQADFIIKNAKINKDTIIIGHSLGGAVLLKVLEKIKVKIARAVFLDAVLKPEFNDEPRPAVAAASDWRFNFTKIKKSAAEFTVLADENFPIIPREQSEELGKKLKAQIIYAKPNHRHFSQAETEPAVLRLFDHPGLVPVPYEELPLELPEVKDYQPTGTGESPLADIKDWVNTKCPRCGGAAKRETNTMPQWAGSSWYYLRYIDPKNKKALADKDKEKYWSPVDFYVGGAEHATRHLIYARFWHKFLFDLGAVNYDEPFKRLQHVGLILAEDGRKMSKRWHNVINPDEIVEKHGADAMRVYEMFMGPFNQACAWSTNGLVGARRFLEKIWAFYQHVKLFDCGGKDCQKVPKGLPQMMHKTVKKVTEDIENFRFNTAISQMMIFINFVTKLDAIPHGPARKFLIILSPFAPHLAEELWLKLGNTQSIFKEEWPDYNPELAKDQTINLVLQVNGKIRDMVEAEADISEEEAKKIALANEKIKKWLEGKQILKVIFVKGKLVNIVVK